MTLSQALVGETIPPRERGRYQGYLAAVSVASSTFGPVAGGYLTQAFGWRSIFLVNVPLGLVAVVLVLRLKTQPGDWRRTSFDAPGLLLFTLFVSPVILALEQVQRMAPDTLPIIAGLSAFGLVSLLALIWQETARGVAAHSACLVSRAVGLARRRLGGLSRRRVGIDRHIPADLSARGARRVAGRDRPADAAA